MRALTYIVFWMQLGKPCCERFEGETALTDSLGCQAALRKMQDEGLDIAFIASAVDNPDRVGQDGATSVGDDYNWMKRRGPDFLKKKMSKLV